MEERTQENRTEPAASRRPRDLAISLLVLIIPLVVLVGGYQLLAGRNQPVAIDPGPRIAEAQRAGLDVTEPAGLDARWVPVSAVFHTTEEGATLRLGYVTPEGHPVQLLQSTEPVEQLLAGEPTAAPAATGPVDVAGVEWQRHPAGPDERALVWERGEVSVVVVGRAGEAELAELAAAMNGPRAP